MAITITERSESFTLPLIPLTGSVFAFPRISITVDISSPELYSAIDYAQKTGSLVYLATQKNPFNEKLDTSMLYSVGTVAKIKQVTKRGPKDSFATLEGICRAEHINVFKVSGHYSADIVIKTLDTQG